jgi:hypothetical protein
MNFFRYPENDHQLLDREFSSDFLRNPDDFPERVDFNYLRNQRDAANHFLAWFYKDEEGSFADMMRKCHRLAAVGHSGSSVYAIRWESDLLIPSIAKDGRVHFETTCGDAFRETHPGVFRSELVNGGVSHPAVDVFDLTREEFDILAALGEESFGTELEWCYQTGKTKRAKRASGSYAKTLGGRDMQLHVVVCESGQLMCYNPIGIDYAKMKDYCEIRIKNLKEAWLDSSMERLFELIVLYYHGGINWMPFSNINNSIFMAHMNSLRRCIGLRPLAHANLDVLGLLASSSGFKRFFQ